MSEKSFIFSVNAITTSLQCSCVCAHTLASLISISIDFALRWRGSPWCLHCSHPEVTDNDQNNFYWEAERESVSRLPCFMGSITQDDGISMNNAVAPCPWPGVQCTPLFSHWHERERAKVLMNDQSPAGIRTVMQCNSWNSSAWYTGHPNELNHWTHKFPSTTWSYAAVITIHLPFF